MTGVEKIAVYGGCLTLDIRELLQARGLDEKRFIDQYLLQERSVYAPFEDAVTMAANAAEKVLTDGNRGSVRLLLVATESGVDFGKPVSGWVQRLCGLPQRLRNLEVKHACYGLTGAIRLAQALLEADPDPGARALVVGTDASRTHLGDPAEPICGGAATAVLLARGGRVVELPPPAESGLWCVETPDTFRPTATVECGNNELSLYSYLDALEGSVGHYRERCPAFHPETGAGYNIYHAPFPAMSFQAHRQVLKSFGAPTPAEIRRSFEQRVLPGLKFSRRLGTSYGSSVWIALASLAAEAAARTPVALFSYGSGCQSEFFVPHVNPDPDAATALTAELDARLRLSVADYEEIETLRAAQATLATYSAAASACGERLLASSFRDPRAWILDSVQDHVRRYRRIGEENDPS
jgi:hydroxymethylglutaryl-CoA synthase